MFACLYFQVQRYDKEKCEELLAHQASQKVYQFDYFFEKSQQERSNFDVLYISDSESDEEEEEVEIEEEDETLGNEVENREENENLGNVRDSHVVNVVKESDATDAGESLSKETEQKES